MTKLHTYSLRASKAGSRMVCQTRAWRHVGPTGSDIQSTEASTTGTVASISRGFEETSSRQRTDLVHAEDRTKGCGTSGSSAEGRARSGDGENCGRDGRSEVG